MERNMGSRDQPGDRPDANFSTAASSQFTHSQYPFPIDAELTMASNYPSVPQSYTQQLQDATNQGRVTASPTQSNFSMTTTNGAGNGIATDPAMAPPQTPNQQSFIANAPRASVDGPSDSTQTPQTGDKRKRSKVSRACDECRRKKVKCNAPVDEHGTPKPCLNCEKAGLECGFERKPLKRGPSKGYIKDLADRVQNVEQVQAAAALRQSIDIGSNSAAFDQAAFSPDEVSAANRYSFSLPQYPFSSPEFQRDRIPSTGAWGSNPPDLRPRDSGSLAIAPDQSLPSMNAQVSDTSRPSDDSKSKEFWSDSDLSRPVKRQKLEQPSDSMESFKIDQAHLSNYYSYVHPLLGLLPTADVVIRVVGNAENRTSHAFAVAVELLSGPQTEVAVNGTHDAESQETSEAPNNAPSKTKLKSEAFSSFDELVQYLSNKGNEQPGLRSEDENLAYIWTSLLLAISIENDFKTRVPTSFATADLLQHSFKTANHLQTDSPDAEKSCLEPRAEFSGAAMTALYLSYLLSNLHALGAGLTMFIKPNAIPSYQGKASFVPDEASYLVQTAGVLGAVVPSMQLQGGSILLEAVRVTINGTLAAIMFPYPALNLQTPLVRQFNLFLKLTLTRNMVNTQPQTILTDCAELVDHLVTKVDKAPTPSRYNPIDIHCYTLVTITALEFVMNASNPYFRHAARDLVGHLQTALEKRSAAYHKDNNGREWFYASEQGLEDGYRTAHWSDCLLNAIEHAKQFAPAEDAWGANDNVVPAFDRLQRAGYLNVLPKFNGE